MPHTPGNQMPHTPEKAFACTLGPKDAKIAIVGEAFGEEEAKLGRPFMGYSGQELTRLLADAGIKRSECFLTNVFNFRPTGNNLDTLCTTKKELGPEYKTTHIAQGKYIRPEYLPEVQRLKEELLLVKPNVVIACGNTACWALLDSVRISSLRGWATDSTLIPGLKVLPTFHPASVLRNWSQRTIVVADLMKAKREAEFPDLRRPRREILIDPTLAEIALWTDTHARKCPILSVDIETKGGLIDCIGFASSIAHALVVPFLDVRVAHGSFWPTLVEERLAWNAVKTLLELPMPKLFQNGLFDLQWLFRAGLRPVNCTEDTMLLHHSLFPEMQKGLGFLGSIYTNDLAWKDMRKGLEELKKDD